MAVFRVLLGALAAGIRTHNMSTDVTVQEKTPESGEVEWELARQWILAWRALKWSFTALAVLGFLTVIGQGFLFYEMFARIHPWLGIGFVILLAAALVLLVGRQIRSFLTTPGMASPPDVHVDPEAPDPAAMSARLRYDLKYLKAISKNPELADQKEMIAAELDAGRALLNRTDGASGWAAKQLYADIVAFERDAIEARLKSIDARVDRIIHAEAVGVGVATAVSMNGTVDAFIVLWRNANLVSRISRLYFGRPHLRGSLLILRDVAAIVVVSRALEDVTDITGDVIGGLLGRMGGLVAGPVMDGAVNAMMTLKLGYLAKRRCRSFEAWSEQRAPALSAEALEKVRKESTSVVTDLMKRCGGLTSSAARATEMAMQGSKNTWTIVRSWFGTPVAKT